MQYNIIHFTPYSSYSLSHSLKKNNKKTSPKNFYPQNKKKMLKLLGGIILKIKNKNLAENLHGVRVEIGRKTFSARTFVTKNILRFITKNTNITHLWLIENS